MDDQVNILLVDDRPENLVALEAVLEPLGECLVRADSGETALREVLRRDFAVILLDANMPGMDGYEVASLLRSRARSAATPIIFITGNDPDRSRIARGYSAGAVDYIVKPFEPDVLRSKVRVFATLLRKTLQIESQAEELRASVEHQRLLLDQNRALEHKLAERAAEAERRAELLRLMAMELTYSEQRERRRLSHMLHDHLQQLLVASLIKIGSIHQHDRDGPGGLTEDLLELRDLVRQAIQSSRTLTIELSPPVLHDGGLAAALQWLVRHMREKHGLTVDLDIRLDGELPNDNLKELLFHAVRELLFNVSKHSGVDSARLTAGIDDGMLCLCIEDEGRGFNPDVVAQDASLRESFGLISIRERLEIFGGRFCIDSRPGEGSKISIWAPHAAKLSPAQPAAEREDAETDVDDGGEPLQAPDPASNGRLRLLLVDDHDLLREGLATLLRDQADMEIVGQAQSGEEAVELVARCHPDVVIMDLSLPRMTGAEATRRIRQASPRTRVIGLSMHDATEMTQFILKAGAEVLLSKDEPSERLFEAIRRPARTNGCRR